MDGGETGLTCEFVDEILEDALKVPPVGIERPLDHRVCQHLILGRFRGQMERENGDVDVDGDVLEPDLMGRGEVGPEVKVVQERALDTAGDESGDWKGML